MSATVHVRPARQEDLEFLREFNCAMAAETEAKALVSKIVGNGVQAVLSDPTKGFYLVAEEGGRVVGQLMVTYEWSDWRNGVFWWIQSVYVVPKSRGRGVFRAMMKQVESIARATDGVCGLRLYVIESNERAHSVYERLGLNPTGYQVREKMFMPRKQTD